MTDDEKRMHDHSMDDIAAGRTQPAKQAIEEIAAEFGLPLARRTQASINPPDRQARP